MQVDGIVITGRLRNAWGQMSGEVGGAACHNKGLWSQELLSWKPDGGYHSCLTTQAA